MWNTVVQHSSCNHKCIIKQRWGTDKYGRPLFSGPFVKLLVISAPPQTFCFIFFLLYFNSYSEWVQETGEQTGERDMQCAIYPVGSLNSHCSRQICALNVRQETRFQVQSVFCFSLRWVVFEQAVVGLWSVAGKHTVLRANMWKPTRKTSSASVFGFFICLHLSAENRHCPSLT